MAFFFIQPILGQALGISPVLSSGLIFFVFLAACVVMGLNTQRQWQQIMTTLPVDAGSALRTPPTAIAPTIKQLEALGMIRLGENFMPTDDGKRRTLWILTTADHLVYARLDHLNPDMPPVVEFVSVFEDEATVETLYPIPIYWTFNKPDFVIQAAEPPLEEAFIQHRQRAEVMKAAHGRVKPIATMEEHLAWVQRRNVRHGHYYLSRMMLPWYALGGVCGLLGLGNVFEEIVVVSEAVPLPDAIITGIRGVFWGGALVSFIVYLIIQMRESAHTSRLRAAILKAQAARGHLSQPSTTEHGR